MITHSSKERDLGVIFDQFLNFDDHITTICRSTHFHIRNIGKIMNLLSYDPCSTIIHALISWRLDYYNYIMYNVPKSKTDRLQRLQNQCARILTKSPRREHITTVLKKLHWLKIQDIIIYKMLTLTYKSYYNMAPPYLCELINKNESHVNTRLGTDHHQLIMPPISKDCSSTFLERAFIYAATCEWNKMSEHIRTSNFDCFRKGVKPMLFTQQYGFLFFFGLEDLYLTKRIDRKQNIHSHKYNHTRTFTCTYTHTINRNMHLIDYIINWKKIHLICLLISIHIPVIYKHILNIEKISYNSKYRC